LADLNQSTYDLSVKNPNKKEEKTVRTPKEILDTIELLDKETSHVINSIRELL